MALLTSLSITFPDYSLIDQFFTINITYPTFDCGYFDKLNYETLIRDSKAPVKPTACNFTHSCTAYGPGSKKDTAQHFHPPRKPLSKAGKVGTIFAGAIVGVVLTTCLQDWWYNKKHSQQELTPAVRRSDVLQLEDVTGGVLRVETPNEDGLPKHARVETSGEILPGYDDSLEGTVFNLPSQQQPRQAY